MAGFSVPGQARGSQCKKRPKIGAVSLSWRCCGSGPSRSKPRARNARAYLPSLRKFHPEGPFAEVFAGEPQGSGQPHGCPAREWLPDQTRLSQYALKRVAYAFQTSFPPPGRRVPQPGKPAFRSEPQTQRMEHRPLLLNFSCLVIHVQFHLVFTIFQYGIEIADWARQHGTLASI